MATTFIGSAYEDIAYYSGWNLVESSKEAYGGTLMLTQVSGAAATLTFNGTSIKVYGMINRSYPGSTPPSSSYIIDGGLPQVYNGVMTANPQNNVQYFASPQLSSGEHTLVVRNLVEDDYFYLDYFLITVVSVTTAAAENSPATTSPASISSPDASGQASTAVLTRPITPEVVVGSSTFTITATQTTSLSASHVSTTSGLATSSSESGSSFGGSSSSSMTRSKIPLGPIVGGVLGGIALLTLIIALILFFRRRDKRMQRDQVHPWTHGPSGIIPFPPPNMSQSSDTSYPYGGFDQQLLASGHAGRGTSHHRFNGESYQGSSNGSSMYTDRQ